MIMNIYRHGDILLRQIESIPETKKFNGLVLAEGETTGHMHRFESGQVMIYGKVEPEYVQVKSDETTLVHQEHKTITIPKGMYQVIHEREYNPFDEIIRRVMD